MKQLFFLFLLLSGLEMAAWAQTGVLNGTVADKQAGEPLQGATIEISGKPARVGKAAIHLLSGLNGTFVVRHLPAGEYSIAVRFIGYEKYETAVTLGGGGVATVLINMEKQQAELRSVEVSGKHDRGSELSSLVADRKADIVQNSVSARTIELSPDLSVANVTQRVSGVSIERSTNGEGQYAIIRGMDKRYMYTLVNGIKIPSPDNKNRYVPLDIFPADLLERLEVTKSLTPNMEGDAIGGTVNMIMKAAPSKFSVNANAAMGYADKFFTQDFNRWNSSPSLDRSPRLSNGPSYQATMKDFPNSAFSYTTRHNPITSLGSLFVGGRVWGGKLGIMAAGSFQNNYRNVDAVVFGLTSDMNNGNVQLTDIESRRYSIQQQRSGVHTRLDLVINEHHKINLYAGYMSLMKNELRIASDTNLQLGRSGPGTGRISNSYRTLHDVQRIANVTLNGEHKLAKNLLLDWKAVYSKATDNMPDEATLNLVTGVSKDPISGALVQAPLNLDATSERQFAHSKDEDKSGYLNLSYLSRIGEAKLDWQVGGMYRNKTRVSSYDDYTLRPTDPSIQVYDGNIDHNNFYVFNGEGTSDNALNYGSKENVGAAYGMLKLELHKLEITGGARYEHTELSWSSNVSETVGSKTGTISYYDVLPSVNLKYALRRRQALRLSYYSAISRPNFYEVVPHIGGDQDADYRERGNANLKRTTSDNFDLRYEYFPRGLDQLLAGVFYKRLHNPIEYALETIGNQVYSVPDNFGNASNYGFELDITKYWRWFGIRVNYTYTNSQITTRKLRFYTAGNTTTVDSVNQTRPMQGQSQHIGNFSLLVKDDHKLGLNAQLAFSYTSRRINMVSQFLDNDVWQKGFAQMDFSVEKKIARHWAIYAKVNNILNTPYQLEVRRPYTGSGTVGAVPYQEIGKNAFLRKDTYGASYLLGVKFKL